MPRIKRTTKNKLFLDSKIQGWDAKIPILISKLNVIKKSVSNLLVGLLNIIWDSPIVTTVRISVRQNKQFIILMTLLLIIKTTLNLKNTGNIWGTEGGPGRPPFLIYRIILHQKWENLPFLPFWIQNY